MICADDIFSFVPHCNPQSVQGSMALEPTKRDRQMPCGVPNLCERFREACSPAAADQWMVEDSSRLPTYSLPRNHAAGTLEIVYTELNKITKSTIQSSRRCRWCYNPSFAGGGELGFIHSGLLSVSKLLVCKLMHLPVESAFCGPSYFFL